MIAVRPLPDLDLQAFVSTLPAPLGTLSTAEAVLALLRPGAAAPFTSDDAVRAAVRDLLRHGGYKPTGRGKPASEFLARASTEGTLASINAAVDVGNAVSLHAGLPISIVDLDRAVEPLRIDLGRPGDTFVFNASGQSIDVEGLPCLFDVQGPCANAVKDAQRTKTDATTRRTLTLIWGTTRLPGRAASACAWYRELLAGSGVATEDPRLAPPVP